MSIRQSMLPYRAHGKLTKVTLPHSQQLAEIDAELKAVMDDILRMIEEMGSSQNLPEILR